MKSPFVFTWIGYICPCRVGSHPFLNPLATKKCHVRHVQAALYFSMAENQVEDGDLEEATEKSEGAGNAGNAASDSTRDG